MRARYLGVGLAGAAYVAASHWLMTRAPASDWNAVVVVGPMLVLASVYAARRRMHVFAAAAALAATALVVQAWRGDGFAPATLYLAQHLGIHLLLAFVFGSTLQPGREPLIAALARRVHAGGGGITAPMAAYARKVTVVWTLYFLAMALLSIGLYAFAPFEAWAVFANLATPLAMLLVFVGEFVLRYRLHPEFERATLAQAMNAYSQRGARTEPAPLTPPLSHD
jgi:uncharacterized membrane protein